MSSTDDTEAETRLVMVDGRDASAYVILRPTGTDGTIAVEAAANDGIDKRRVAQVLRHIADQWAPRPGLTGVLDEIAAERGRQDVKFGEQNHRDGTGPDRVWAFTGPAAYVADCARTNTQRLAEEGHATWLDISLEEFAEAAAESDPAKLRAELVQTAAVFVNWIEALDRRTGHQAGGLAALLQAVAEQLPADDPDRAAEGLARMPLPADGPQEQQ